MLGALGLGCIGVLAALPAGEAGNAATGATVVRVTAGKPTELGFELSKTLAVPAGTITFEVSNAGKLAHDFELCTAPVTSSAANSCKGKATKLLRAGQSAKLTVTLSKPGSYEFLSTAPGQARRGMKGVITVTATTPPAPATTTAATTAPSWGPTGPCTSPQSTTVNVTAFDYGFTLSQNPVHCGTITFVQSNTGTVPHNFDINGVSVPAYLNNPGQVSTVTVNFPPGNYRYICDITGHDTFGMIGTLVVTN
jgi:uncharacterized cupredoxin-like copper-binding protein